jgi:DNA polymerase-3 subunit chi
VTRIDFYHGAEDRIAVACRLIGKALQQKMRVLVYTPDKATAQAIDQMLWAAPQIAFIPHCMAGHKLAAETPVLIAQDAQSIPHDEVLLNLHEEWPPAFSRYQRLLEIVTHDENDKLQARNRYKFYKDRGYPIQTHNLAN